MIVKQGTYMLEEIDVKIDHTIMFFFGLQVNKGGPVTWVDLIR